MRHVSCEGSLHVAYDLTALSDAADLGGFAAGFAATLAAWQLQIAAAP